MHMTSQALFNKVRPQAERHPILEQALTEVLFSGIVKLRQDNLFWNNKMPTTLLIGPYRFFFYAGDGDEPPHIHVERDNSTAKFWLDPVRLQKSRGFSRNELGRVQRLVEEHSEQLLRSWNEYFGD